MVVVKTNVATYVNEPTIKTLTFCVKACHIARFRLVVKVTSNGFLSASNLTVETLEHVLHN